MTFKHELVPLDPISNRDLEHGRFYDTPGGSFPSVTTVIGWAKGTAELDRWRKAVGEDRAARVGNRARVRGTAVHDIAERYVGNDPGWKAGSMPVNLDSFLSIRPLLDRHLGRVFGIEVPLWSSRLRTAGRTDLWAEWDGVPAIIDYKTSLRPKTEERIWGYLVQKTCYGEMVEERTGREVPRIVTLMMVDNEPPQVWVRDRADYVGEMERVFIDHPRP